VKAEIAMAAASAVRTDGPAGAAIVWGIDSAMPGCSAPPFEVPGPCQYEA